MKPNGRRRWRKWLAHKRRRRYEPAASWGRDRQRTGLARRHQGEGWAGWDLPSCLYLPASPQPTFSPRSLIGMTQGARKRAAWKSFSERARYHIGQRLRPCPGCLRCRSCAGCEVLTFEGDTCEDCGRETPMATESCDGSGVLPARRAKS